MTWMWNPVALPGIAALVIGMLFAGFVYFVRPSGIQNRRLALVIFFESLTWGTGAGLLFATTDFATAVGLQAIFQVGLLVLPWVYLRFVATLDSPLSSWMRHRAVDVALLIGALVSPLLYFQDRSRFVTGFDPVWYARWEAHLGPWFGSVMLVNGLATLFAVGVALHVVWRNRGASALARSRSRAYLYAFGIRDGMLLGLTLVVPLFAPFPPTGTWTDLVYANGAPMATVLWIPVAALGILRSQLFDIDVKIKLTLERSTLIALFAGVAFLISELVENLFVGRLTDGRLVLSLAGAAALAFLFRRMPQRLADRLMPGVEDPANLDARREEVYRSACEGAMKDGVVDPRELSVLEHLRASLGLSNEEAAQIARTAGMGQ